MKLVTPEISWHNRDPIYSVDFQYTDGNITRLVTSGTDKNIRIWSITESTDEPGKVNVEFLSNLDRHSRAVNVVRFSPDGLTLASAGDDSVIVLWRLQGVTNPAATLFDDEEGEANNKETWTVHKMLRGHLEDIYDLCWSPDGERMITGSVDNSALLWDVKKAKPYAFLKESTSFIQGVAWDPKNKFVATLSCDRKCRIYSVATNQCLHTIQKTALPNQPSESGEPTKPKFFRMYHDDTMKSFFRRLAFSPDGEILVTPAGVVELGEKEKSDDVKTKNDDVIIKDDEKEKGKDKLEVNATFLFSRAKFSKPAAYLPYPPKATVAARCCPRLFALREIPRKDVPADADPENLKPWEKYQTLFCLPYRVVFAVATEDGVLLYDSQQTMPIAYVTKIHYHQLSDLTWSSDGRLLVVSSTDGYCTIINFDQNELGELYVPPAEEKASVDQEVAEKLSEKLQLLTEPAFKSPEQLPVSNILVKTGEETMDLHLELDDSGDEMDTAPPTAENKTETGDSAPPATDDTTAKIVSNAPSAVDAGTKIVNSTPLVEKSGTNEKAPPTSNSDTNEKSDPKPRRIAFTTLIKK